MVVTWRLIRSPLKRFVSKSAGWPAPETLCSVNSLALSLSCTHLPDSPMSNFRNSHNAAFSYSPSVPGSKWIPTSLPKLLRPRVFSDHVTIPASAASAELEVTVFCVLLHCFTRCVPRGAGEDVGMPPVYQRRCRCALPHPAYTRPALGGLSLHAPSVTD